MKNICLKFLLLQGFLFFTTSAACQVQGCIDTSFKKLYSSPIANLKNIEYIVNSKDTGILAGNYYDIVSGDTALYLIKLTPQGNVFWAKKIYTSSNRSRIQNVIEDGDGNIYCLVNYVQSAKQVNLMKFSGSAILLLNKKVTVSSDQENIKFYAAGNNLYLSGFGYDGIAEKINILKLDLNLNVSWSKKYTPITDPNTSCGYLAPLGLVEIEDSILLMGKMNSICFGGVLGGMENNHFAMKIAVENGALGKSVSYLSPAEPGLASGALQQNAIFSFNISKTPDNIFFYSRRLAFNNTLDAKSDYKATIDKDLNIFNGSLYSTALQTFSKITIDALGNTNILYTGNDQYMAKFDQFNNVIRQKKIAVPFGGSLAFYGVNPFASKRNYMSVLTNYNAAADNYLQLIQLNNEEKNSDCFGKDTSFIKIIPYEFSVYQSPFIGNEEQFSIAVADMQDVSVNNLVVNMQDICSQISTCNVLKIIEGEYNICNKSQPYIYRTTINGNCYKSVAWQIDTSVIENMHLLNDTSITIKFKKAFKGYLYASINSCSILKDSIFVNVFDIPANISLGKDTGFCAGTSYLLNAKTGYDTYKWQDGSTDSLLYAIHPGKYYVTAVDFCGNIFSDTIQLSHYPLPVINLGSDTSICKNDLLKLDAGAGFKSYLWNNQSVSQIIYAKQIGKYIVRVESQNGCYTKDSLSVIDVKVSPENFLNTREQVCVDQTIKISPNAFFVNYLWNTGVTDNFIDVGIGTYSLTVTGSNGCKGSDTIEVIRKNCPVVFFIPNAFTPENNGLNEIFKPVIHGHIISYEFSVYNRYGQNIFITRQYGIGWNGRHSGIMQNTGVFIWQCKYVAENGETFHRKGTVLLIR